MFRYCVISLLLLLPLFGLAQQQDYLILQQGDTIHGTYFSDGLISVGIGPKKERKFGYIDPSGKEVIPLIYKQAGVFKSGRARVTDFNNRTFYIDKIGKEIN